MFFPLRSFLTATSTFSLVCMYPLQVARQVHFDNLKVYFFQVFEALISLIHLVQTSKLIRRRLTRNSSIGPQATLK